MTGSKETIAILVEGLEGNPIQKEYCALSLTKLELAGYDIYKFMEEKEKNEVSLKIQDGMILSEDRMLKYAMKNLLFIILASIIVGLFCSYYIHLSKTYSILIALAVLIINMLFRRGYNHILFIRNSNKLYKKNVDNKILDIE